MKAIRVGSGDPGRFRSSFAFCLTVTDIEERITYVTGAHGWKGMDYPQVEEDIAKIHEEKKLDIFVVEKNNTGIHVIESLKHIHHIPVYGITTSNRIRSKKVIDKGETMDKYEIAGWVESQRQKKKILFPKKKTPGIKTLINQLNSFVRNPPTKGGTVTYSAQGKNRDDFVMAFLLNCHYIKTKILKDRSRRHLVISKKFRKEPLENLIGSGIPKGARLTGKTILNPIGSYGSTRKWTVH